ncbi:sugar ABC transporter substrate-binding protein [Modestobacter excelsi]|uniref:sugar ABC transporter substrate-binding protein n=1 Tax=Modestobacter excelsi TaxID=2213161 RepID=UPI001C20CAE5|nr:substrate-binding domain-containing protein [Modestobacter excelsi]
MAACEEEVAATTAANLDAADQDPFPKEAVDGAAAKGKNFWYIGLAMSNGSIAAYAEGATAAAEALGATMTVFDGKGTPGTMAQGIQNAIAARADGIILGSTGTEAVAEAVRNAESAGIPVLDGLNGVPAEPLAEGVAMQVSPDFTEVARMQVNWVLNEYGCDGTHVLSLASPNGPPSQAFAAAVDDEMSRLCPSCKNTLVEVPVGDVPTKLTPAVQTALQRDPGVKAVLSPSDPFVPFVQQAIAATGSDAGILGHNGTQIQAAIEGQVPLVADAVYAPPVVVGWFLVDGMLRGLQDGTYSGAIPEVLKDESNWGTDPDLFALVPTYAEYPDAFKKLWGVN